MAAWGVVSGLTATVQNFRGLVAVRFFLGFVEALVYPHPVNFKKTMLIVIAHTFPALYSYCQAGTPVKS